jgi:hypothetical protein
MISAGSRPRSAPPHGVKRSACRRTKPAHVNPKPTPHTTPPGRTTVVPALIPKSPVLVEMVHLVVAAGTTMAARSLGDQCAPSHGSKAATAGEGELEQGHEGLSHIL